jgi:hypothetical protein
MPAPEILATLAADDPAAFVKHIVPVVREAAAASRTGQVTERGEHDQAFGSARPRCGPSMIRPMRSSAGRRRLSRRRPAQVTGACSPRSGRWPSRCWLRSNPGGRRICCWAPQPARRCRVVAGDRPARPGPGLAGRPARAVGGLLARWPGRCKTPRVAKTAPLLAACPGRLASPVACGSRGGGAGRMAWQVRGVPGWMTGSMCC